MTEWEPESKPERLAEIQVAGCTLRPGSRVKLCPIGRGDILDLALSGKTATIEAIEQDFEDRIYLSVTCDDDPGRDLGLLRQPGHRFFFGVDEVELLETSTQASDHEVWVRPVKAES
jgi:hypothetical protein